MIKRLIQKIIEAISLKYEIYKIYKTPIESPNIEDDIEIVEVGQNELEKYDKKLFKKYLPYFGEESYCYVYVINGTVAGICFYWFGERYKERNFIKLDSNEAKLVQIEVVESMRGKGIAKSLIQHSTKTMHERGFNTLYARIWHSNKPSVKTFTKSGWLYQKTIITVSLAKLKLKFRLP